MIAAKSGKGNNIHRNYEKGKPEPELKVEKIRYIVSKIIIVMESITTIQPPRTIREVWENLPEGTHAQIIENQLIMSAAPLDRHQKVLNKIIRPLLNYTEDNPVGEIRIAPSSVFLDDKNI